MKKIEMALIGVRLREARVRAGVTQEEAAMAAGLARTTITNMEAGVGLAQLVKFRRLISLYGVTGYEVLFGENPYEMTAAEAKELAQAARGFSPALERKVELLLTLSAKPGAAQDSPADS